MVFLAGLLSIVVQVMLLRELSAAFYGVDLIYLLALGAWMLWTAAGAFAGRRSLHPSARRVSIILLATAFVVPLEVALVRRLPLLLGGIPGAYLPLPTQMAASALCLLPPSLLLGLMFQAAAKRYMSPAESPRVRESEVRRSVRRSNDPSGTESKGAPSDRASVGASDLVNQPSDPRTVGPSDGSPRTLARAYAIESVGGMVGGLLATLTLHAGVQNLTLALLVGGLAAIAAALSSRPGRPPAAAGGPLAVFSWLLAVVCAAGVWHTQSLDWWMTRWTHPDAVASVDSPYGRLTVEARAGQVSVYENGALTLESEGTAAEDFAHLSLVQHARPTRVLLVGGVAAGLVAPVAAHHPRRLDDVDLDRRMAQLVVTYLPGARTRSVRGPDVHVVFDDPRRTVASLPDRYDVIVLAAAEPTSAQANRFFTREFLADCAAHLHPDGVISLRLASVENLWTPQVAARTGSIYAALREVFSDIVVLPGSTNVVVASRSPLVRDPDVLAARLAERGLTPRLVSARYLRYLYSNDRYSEIDRRMRAYQARPNTDANAACYQATSLLWLSKFVPSIGQTDLTWVADAMSWRRLVAWLLLGVIAAIALTWRLAGWSRNNAAVCLAAFSGMTLEVLLLVHYQLKQGVMFEALGVLLMSVMAGLAAGAVVIERLRRARDGAPRGFGRIAVVVPLLGLAALALVTSFAVRSGYTAGLLSTGGALFLSGAAVGAVFSAVSARAAGDRRAVVSPLYAADVVGGSAGSLVAALVMIPLLGLPLTAEWSAAVAIVTLILA